MGLPSFVRLMLLRGRPGTADRMIASPGGRPPAHAGWRPAHWFRLLIFALALFGSASTAVAQTIPSDVLPGRERQQFADPPRPRAQPGGPRIALPSTTAPPGAAETMLVVRAVRVTGSTIYSEEQLRPLYEALLGRRVPLQAVYDLAQRITAKYGADGYVLTRAIVPPQELNPGGATVRIEVVEGYVNRVEWPREKLARYKDFFTSYSAKITAQRPINISTLERYLLLANDLPGLKFTTALKPSPTERGAATLVIDVTYKPVDVLARADNRGTAARGPYQFLVSPTFNNVVGRHEALTITYATVLPPKELQYIAPSWRQVLNSEGVSAFVNASYAWGNPGTQQLEDLAFRTTSLYVEGGFQSPVIRAREKNLNLTALIFGSDNYGFWNLTPGEPQSDDRLRGMRLRADGDFADRFGGISQATVTFSQGIQGLGSTSNNNPTASRLGGRVDFTKIEGYFARLQPLGGPVSALFSAYGQYTDTPLLVPEQCGYGGRVFGRAYDPSQILGDSCAFASLELRLDVPPPKVPAMNVPLPDAQLYGYADYGYLYRMAVNTETVHTASATFNAASAGAGIRWRWQNDLNVDLSAAKAIEGPSDAWRFFFIVTARR